MKRIVLPALRERGFEGELPDLRRLTDRGTHLFSVQTSKYGGSFIVELGRVQSGPYTTSSGEVMAPDRLTSAALRLADRARLRADSDPNREVWFRYAHASGAFLLARVTKLIGSQGVDPVAAGFERAARAVLALLPECDQWWDGANGLPHVRSYAEQERTQCEAGALARDRPGAGAS